MTESFWNIPKDLMKTPTSILKEQAAALTKQTKGLLVGEVEFSGTDLEMFIYLNIRVPSLGSYKVHILSYNQPLALYPGMLVSQVIGSNYQVGSEEVFVQTLKSMLSSERMQRILSSLISQARPSGSSTDQPSPDTSPTDQPSPA